MRTGFALLACTAIIQLYWVDLALGQVFTRITDPSNPIVNDAPPPGYPGCSWVDYDNDGRLDLSITGPAPNYLYRNLGNGNFVAVITNIGATQPIAPGFGGGHSWADYDNDGDLDVCVTGATTFLYRNDGNNTFTRILDGVLADSVGNRGWACTWGDYDQDGDVDLVIVHPANFFPPGSTPNVFLRNNGSPNYTFTKDDTSAIVSQGFQAYTVGSFVDYDLDNDLDFFIGSGPVNATGGVDFMYRNMKMESGIAYFNRITNQPFASDLGDAQNWNWIDFDNDGDLDGYRTNYGFNGPGSLRQNDLYRNNGGTFAKVTSGAIVTDQFVSLTNLWGDFDNDGDLDCYVGNEPSTRSNYYQNNGDGTFTSITTGDLVATAGSHRAASAGDYDNDGDLDLMVVGPGTAARGLYRNDLSNGNKWVNIRCIGTTSDKAAIGTKVRAKATFGGHSVWQIREVSSQNSFNGANMLNVHFGFADAPMIDSLIVTWPRGLVQMFTNITLNHFYTLVEGQGIVMVGVDEIQNQLPSHFELRQNYPNPFNPTTTISFAVPTHEDVSLKVFDILGREVATFVQSTREAGDHRVNVDGSNWVSGVYYYRLVAGGLTQTKTMLLMK